MKLLFASIYCLQTYAHMWVINNIVLSLIDLTVILCTFLSVQNCSPNLTKSYQYGYYWAPLILIRGHRSIYVDLVISMVTNGSI